MNPTYRRWLRSTAAGLGLVLVSTIPVLSTSSPAQAAGDINVQVLATNDFHGRLVKSDTQAGAAVLAGAVKQLEAANPNTVFAAAGDLIGASTFDSFIAKDKPTIDALNEAGLDVSAAGNHEFDQGYRDLLDRVMAPYDATTNPYGGASWRYLAANVRKRSDSTPGLARPGNNGESWVKEFCQPAPTDCVQVGFIGAVTEHLSELVSPAGIAEVSVTGIVSETNRIANQMKTDGVDVVILLVHEGAATTALASATDPSSDFGKIVNGVNPNVDAIVSGHTHLAYNHSIPVPAWQADPARVVKNRPVVSAGQYGMNLNQLVFTLDSTTGQLKGISQAILPLTGSARPYPALYPEDPATALIVSQAVAAANVLGARVLGKIAVPFNRARLADGSENRGAESPLGNLVAEVHRWATRAPAQGAAQLAFMNPGGLRDDMLGLNTSGYPADVTYRQAANVQSFANTLVNMRLTGAQIKLALEQQWQPAGAQRPFLRLGTSTGFRYTYDPARPAGQRILQMWLNGTPIDPAATYSVTANSFLAAGGDNFTVFSQGTDRRDTGQVDLQAMVDYLAANGTAASPLRLDPVQHSVGVTFPTTAPAKYLPNRRVKLRLSSWAFSTTTDPKDTSVSIELDGKRDLGTAPVNNVIGLQPFDEYGVIDLAAKLPANTRAGDHTLVITGATTGTEVTVPIRVKKAPAALRVVVKPKPARVLRDRVKVKVKVKSLGAPSGRLKITVAGKTYRIKLKHGKAVLRLRPFGTAGKRKVVVRYPGNGSTMSKKRVVWLKVRPRR